jgi:plastocyanin
VVVLVVACGGAEISPDKTASTAKILPDPCTLLSDTDVANALAAPAATPAPTPAPGGSPSVTPATSPGATPVPTASPTPAATITLLPPTYGARAVTAGQKTVNAGVCTYQALDGGEVIVSVLPKSALSTLAEGGAVLGPAQLLESTSTSLLSLQYGDAVVEVAIVLGQVDSVSRANRLATLGSKLAGSVIPTLAPVAAGATPGARPVFTPPPPPGEVVSSQAAATTVKETDSPAVFTPADASIKTGAVIEWDNAGTEQHNVIFDDYAALSSNTMNVGDKYQVKFTVAGTYSYHCTIHPGMNGSLTVR